MKRELIRFRAAGPAVAVAALIFAGCGEDQGTPEGFNPYKTTEPKYVLANVESAFNRKDADLLTSSLGDGFRFYFDVNDVGAKVNGYVIPERWSESDFMRAAGNMFARTYSIAMTCPWRTMGSPGPGEKTFVATGVPLRIVVMMDEVNGYALDDGTCDYEFEQGDGGAWRLTLWRDRSRECGCVGELTLGRLLAGYYL
jgi:hypothetical protein